MGAPTPRVGTLAALMARHKWPAPVVVVVPQLLHLDAKGKKPPRPVRPAALERRYTEELLRRQRAVHNVMMEELHKVLRKVGESIDARADGARHDSPTTDLAAILRVVDAVTLAVKKQQAPSTAALEALGEKTDAMAGATLTRQVQSVFGVSAVTPGVASEQLIAAWTAENVSLITSIDSRYFAEIEAAVAETVKGGGSTRDLVKQIEARYDVSRSRAQLIAVDQIGTLNSNITQAKQRSIGIKGYTWSDSGDERVRPEHEAINGQKFLWSEGGHPTEGNPGEPIRCRCVAIPDFDAVDPLEEGSPVAFPENPAAVEAPPTEEAPPVEDPQEAYLRGVQERSAELAGYIPPDQAAALEGYAANDYIKMNGWLRDKAAFARPTTAEMQRISAIDQAIAKRVVDPGTMLYRAADIDTSALKVGDVMVDRAFISTSMEDMGSQFGTTQLRITVGADTRGVSVAHLSRSPEELELILARRTPMKITDITTEGDMTIIHVTTQPRPL